MTKRNLGRRGIAWGLAFAVGAHLAACSGGGGSGQVADDISVGLTTQGGATTVAPGGTLGIKANVNNASTVEVTWSLSGPSCPASCGTITATAPDYATYAAPSGVTAPFTVTVTATSVQNTKKSGSVTLTIEANTCAASASLLSGHYAFLLQGFDQASRVGIAAAGSFMADGCGVITGGEADYYLGPTAAGHTALSGQYSVGADRRGTLTLAVGTASQTFAIALGKVVSGVAAKGAMTEMDPFPTTVLSGSLWRQDPTTFSLDRIAGSYAFVLNGWNGTGPREAMGGTVHADGAGHFDTGLLDRKAFNAAPITGTAWSGAYGAPSGNGRMVLTAPELTGASGSGVAYVVGAGQLVAVVSDATPPGRVFSGSMLSQTGPFGLGSLSGTGVAYQTANYDQLAFPTLTMSVLTLFSANGSGSLSTGVDVNAGGNYQYVPAAATYAYTVSADGHATLSTTTVPPVDGGRWYLVAPNTALMLGFDAGVSVGMILPRADGPFTAASISGSYFSTQAPGASYYAANGSGIATSSGDGTLTTVMDRDTNGSLVAGQGESASLSMAGDGRATWLGNVLYILSPSTFFMMNETTSYPVVQVFEQ